MEEKNTLGIVGGGQLGRMLTEAAIPLGREVWVAEKGLTSPAQQVGAHQIEGSIMDGEAITRLVERCAVTTWEIEHINTEVLIDLAGQRHDIQPSPQSLTLIGDKLTQKEHLHGGEGLPVANFKGIDDEVDFEAAKAEFEDGLLIKARKGGYDGRGNLVVTTQTWPQIVKHFVENHYEGPLYAERMVQFQKELAVIIARSKLGELAVYPVVETIHKENICNIVLSPAPIDPKIREAAEELGRATVGSFEGAGVFAVEMFLDDSDQVLVNEVAPRVHNSGHLTIEANETSQFEQHIRAILGWPLGETDLISPAAAMVNILGERDGPVELAGMKDALALPDTHIHLYGKSPTKKARKMGHITTRADTLEEAQATALRARRLISI